MAPDVQQDVLLLPGQAEAAALWRRAHPDAAVRALVAPGAEPAFLAFNRALAAPLKHVLLAKTRSDFLAPETAAALSGAPGRCLIIPADLPARPLRFAPERTMPDATGLYGALTALQPLGYTRFVLTTSGGCETPLHMDHVLPHFAGIHRGKRAFVVGNGPSLNALPMKRLMNEITLGANRCFLGFRDWGYPFTYWGIMDRLQIETYAGEYLAGVPEDCTCFYPFEYAPLLPFANSCPVPFDYSWQRPPSFGADGTMLYQGYSVCYMLVQLAALMGCDPIVLIGMDHSYNLANAPTGLMRGWEETVDRVRGWALRTSMYSLYRRLRGTRKRDSGMGPIWQSADANAPTHFTGAYTKEKRFARPRPERTEAAMAAAVRWGRKHGVTILNATPGTALKSVPLADFDSLF